MAQTLRAIALSILKIDVVYRTVWRLGLRKGVIEGKPVAKKSPHMMVNRYDGNCTEQRHRRVIAHPDIVLVHPVEFLEILVHGIRIRAHTEVVDR